MTWNATGWPASRRALNELRFLVQFMFGGSGRVELTTPGAELKQAGVNEADGFYYGYIIGQGRDFLADELRCVDPFELSPAEIVEHVLAAGYRPNLEHERRLPFGTQGEVNTIALDDRCFIVSVDLPTETIIVQEVRADPYEREG